MLELDCGLEFNLARAEEDFFQILPPRSAVCLIEPREEKAEPFLIRTQDLQRRLQRLLGPRDPTSKRLNLRGFARGVRYRLTGSRFEQTLTYYQHAKQIFPKRYRDLLRLRPPAVLKLNLRNPYPRCYVTRRLPVDESGAPAGGTYYGPFASRRSAEAFASGFLDFFKVRRCQIKIRRDPSFPGCIYSEMKMCLAPCFAGCTKGEYDGEVQKVARFLETDGESLRETIETERESASTELDFERAAGLHKRIEKLDDMLRMRPELARRVQDLDAVIVQRSAEEQSVGVFVMMGGRLSEPYFLRFGQIASQPRSAEQIIRDRIEQPMAGPLAEEQGPLQQREPGDLAEDLWLVAKWYYSKPREGEIFFREKEWPYRKILRACSRLLAAKKGEAERVDPPEPAKPGEGAS